MLDSITDGGSRNNCSYFSYSYPARTNPFCARNGVGFGVSSGRDAVHVECESWLGLMLQPMVQQHSD